MKKSLAVFALLVIASAALYNLPYTRSAQVADTTALKGEQSPDDRGPRLVFFGDMMFDRQVRRLMEENGADYPFAKFDAELKGYDEVVANLEGPITQNASRTADYKNKTLQFTFDPHVALVLKNHGVTIVGLANNHTLNFGQEGLLSTRRYLASSSVEYYGSPSNAPKFSHVKTIKGKKVALVGYHEFTEVSAAEVAAEIHAIRPQVDFLVVSPHWGTEYKNGFTISQQNAAHLFVDAGADAVIGSHPHVIEPVEIYKGRAIFYSLGNFVFDQNFSAETTRGLSVAVRLENEQVTYTLTPFSIVNSQPVIMDEKTKDGVMNSLAELSVVDRENRTHIKKGTFALAIRTQ